MIRLPLIGALAVLLVVVLLSIVGLVARGYLRQQVRGRPPCARWFAVFAGILVSASIFSAWIGTWGLGAADSGVPGALFGLFAGAVWGAIFSAINVAVLWQAFLDEPPREGPPGGNVFESDLGELAGAVAARVRAFRFRPRFARATPWSWAILGMVVVLSALWSVFFCLLTWLTEGTPHVPPRVPLS